jgi:hypothetical protein
LHDLGFVGAYTDGNGHVSPCRNTHHGCGYHDANGALLVIGNLAHRVVDAGLVLDLDALGIEAPSAVNALSRRALSLTGNVLSVRLRPTSMVLAWLE